jgi:hypothetical protein
MQSATNRGFAHQTIGMTDEGGVYPGVQMELAGVHDVVPGQIEIYEGGDSNLHGRSLWPHAYGITLASFSTVGAYRELISRKDNHFSQKIAPSFPIYISSFLNRKNMGFYYPMLTQGGVMYIGDACGGSGIVHGMISAHYASRVALDSIKEQKARHESVKEYTTVMHRADIVQMPFCYRHIRDYYGTYRNWLEQSRNIAV